MKKWLKLLTGGMTMTGMAVSVSACSNSSASTKYDKSLS